MNNYYESSCFYLPSSFMYRFQSPHLWIFKSAFFRNKMKVTNFIKKQVATYLDN